MANQPRFPFPLVKWCFEREEIEDVRVFQGLLCKIGLGIGKKLFEIGNRLPLPTMYSSVDHHRPRLGGPDAQFYFPEQIGEPAWQRS